MLFLAFLISPSLSSGQVLTQSHIPANTLETAKKIDNIAFLKRNSRNIIFKNLGLAPRTRAFEMKDYWIWDSSVVQSEDGKFHIFASRFPKKLPFHPGWMVASEVVHAVSNHASGPFTFSDVSLPARGSQYWDGRSTHNPQIRYYNRKYYLFYMGSTHPFEEPTFDKLTLNSKWCIVGRSNKRIGLAVSESPYGPWKRLDTPILTTQPNTFYNFLISNPAPVIQEDGSVMLMFKGREYSNDSTHSGMQLGMAYAPNPEGPYSVINNHQPIFKLDDKGEVEDPFLWKDENGFHAVFKDHSGKITGERGGGVLAHSKDGIQWNLDADPKAYSLTIEWEDKNVEKQGQVERPFILFDKKRQPSHIYFATMDGIGEFHNATDSWTMVIPFNKEKK